MTVYCISGFLAGVAGLVVVAINRSADPHQVGQYMELDAIAAVAVGGTPLSGGRATILGTFFGAMIIQRLRFTLIAHNIPDGITRQWRLQERSWWRCWRGAIGRRKRPSPATPSHTLGEGESVEE